jgi:hypothetical protein
MTILKYIIWGIATLTILYILFVSTIVFKPHVYNYFNRTEFNQEQWKTWVETESAMSLRWNMVHDLTSEYELVGMTRQEIINLLGPPDNENQKFHTSSYYLGMAGFGIDTGSLIIKFKDGKVIKYEIWHG